MKFFPILLTMLVLVSLPVNANTDNPLSYIELANGERSADVDELLRWTHVRFVFNRKLRRVAVGQESIAEVDVLNEKELLVLAKNVGKTSMMVWFMDGTSHAYMLSVAADLSFLESALKTIDPYIRIDSAPDRQVLLLTGSVGYQHQKIAAEQAALSYLQRQGKGVASRSTARDVLKSLSTPDDVKPGQPPLINLIRVRHQAERIEDRITRALNEIGTDTVKVRRIRQEATLNSNADTLMLEGEVQTQAELSRVLAVVSRLFVQPGADVPLNSLVQVYADEAGRVVSSAQGSGSGQRAVQASTAELSRANVLSIAGGSVLSMIRVKDIPQLRVSVQMYEVSLNRLKEWQPGVGLSTNAAGSASLGNNNLEAALSLFNGALAGQLQIAGQQASLNALFSMLESEGISRTLSKPTITLMSGDSGTIQVGGEVPIRSTYTRLGQESDNPDTLGDTLLSRTEFKPYGIQLKVKAVVDETDHIALQLNPRVSTPDTLLSKHITDSTGSTLATTAFDVRSINTSTRLRDGQPLIIGGLVSRDQSESNQALPFLAQIPFIGKLFRSDLSSYRDRELVIVVTPTIVREPLHQTALWEFADTNELLRWSVNPRPLRNRYSFTEEARP
ncbi:pilus assembly protein N-terminal domain-containing protein [Oceanobacter antarcticus]|uniref:Pilus assembly protein N-terminal domain-containing protein n=1 Tax=Oceanobacter antarcticus TaxID=3133425 RepID=A0ABW8NFZ8_9GAMM